MKSNDGITHWEGCWRDPKHHACLLAMLERDLNISGLEWDTLEESLRLLRADLDRKASERDGLREYLHDICDAFEQWVKVCEEAEDDEEGAAET